MTLAIRHKIEYIDEIEYTRQILDDALAKYIESVESESRQTSPAETARVRTRSDN